MPDGTRKKNGLRRSGKFLLLGMVACVGTMLVLVLALKIYLSTPFAAAQVSRLLASRLHQPVTVTGLRTAGGTLHLTGFSLGNPPGFPAGNLASADSIAIAPQWLELLRGRQRFNRIALDGVRLHILKNSTGGWNFSHLQQRLASGKPSTGETFVGELVVKGGAIQVNGQGVHGLSLRVFNLTTKGSADSRVALAFEDSVRNRYLIDGTARLGKEPALDLTLTAPSLSLERLAGMLTLKNIPAFQGGRGNLRVVAGLHGGQLRVRGGLEFSRISVPQAQGMPPLDGTLTVEADYNLHTDEVRLESLALSVNNLVKAQARGTIAGLRRERRFQLDVDIDRIGLDTLALFLPEPERRKIVLGGELGARAIRLSGNGAQGVTAARGALLLNNGSLTREGRLIASGLDGSLSLAGTGNGFVAKGRLLRRKSGDKALLERIDAPIQISLSPRMKPLLAEVSPLSARIMGVPLGGRLAFRATAAEPFTLSLRIPATGTAAINPLLEKLGVQFLSGTASLVLEATGRGPRDFNANATAQLAAWQVSKGKKAFAVKQAFIDSRFGKNGGKFGASGKVRLAGLVMEGRTADANFSYGLADGMATLSDVELRYGGGSVAFARLAARVPVRETSGGVVRFPLSLEMNGADIRQGQVALNALSGTLRGGYSSGAGGRWLEGIAELAAGGATWHGKAVGAPTARFVFSRSGGKGEVGGTLLGGKLNGQIAFNPFALETGGDFKLGIRGARLAVAADFLPDRTAIRPSDGLLDADISGGYSRPHGLECRFATRVGNLALTGRNGKSILANGGIGFSGTLSGQRISINDAVLNAGDGVVLKARGEITEAFSAKREGGGTITLPETAINSLMDPIANILPRSLQEANFDGSMAGEAGITLHNGQTRLNGSLHLKGAGLVLQSQRFNVAGINGTLPFSLEFPGAGIARAADALSFSRQNYPKLLEQFRRAQVAGTVLTVGSLGFGPLYLGPLTMHVAAGNGVTSITSLRAPLYQGELFGKGYVTVGQGIQYRGDLLINDLSLMQLCNVFPKIRGYISGRLDGIISLSGEGAAKTSLLGFSELWTRSGSGERMKVSREFLQKLAGKKLRGFFFQNDRAYDQAEITAILKEGHLTFETLDIMHTNIFGIRDLSVVVAPGSNRVSLESLFNTIKQAGARGKAVSGEKVPAEAPVETEFKWLE